MFRVCSSNALMTVFLKSLLFLLIFMSCKAFGKVPANISCIFDSSSPNHTSVYITDITNPSTSGTISSCCKVPVTLSILVSYAVISFAILHYLGIHEIAIVLASSLLQYIAFEKVTALFFLVGIAYWLKDYVLEQIPSGTTLFYYFQLGEQVITTSISMTGRGIIFLFDGLGIVVELGLDLIDTLLAHLFAAIFLRRRPVSP